MKYSEVVTIGTGEFPIIGLAGLVHGDETVSRKVLDYLQQELTHLNRGQVKLIYANLPAEEKKVIGVEDNLNKVFPGRKDGNLEEKIAYDLREPLSQCHFVLDIHSTTLSQEPFVISALMGEATTEIIERYAKTDLWVESRREIDSSILGPLVRKTGLSRHVQMNPAVTNGGSLIEYVNAHGLGYGISFEAGGYNESETVQTALKTALNFLRSYGVIDGKPEEAKKQEFYLGQEFILVPSKSFVPSSKLKNFELLAANIPYGHDNEKEYSLNKDCYVLLYSPKMRDGKVFLRAEKIF